ncbi:pirin family protein [Saccharothrix yanglingensis]|uniref:Pirin n=1 Tax=Saccharothrix yanglingensis TaxID=659496 RepID=A0ABU0WVV6_9PSEU|nr:pirin family protein [Saccharothrix yanglingensis]MDQ2583988.1 pirin [Saccharothrix yanglingensis]
MSNVEADPAELVCATTSGGVEVLGAREVPLGGPRAMTVRRTLPQRSRTMIGAWCFADHYGPDDVSVSGGMDVAPHPHTGLQTASWLFSGEVEHRDSLGVHALVRPGELNLMTAGRGICHSEVSTPATTVLHGVQLWIALPDAHRDVPRDFQHHAPEPVAVDGAVVRLFLGTLLGRTSPVRTFTPLLGAEVVLEPGARLALDVDPAHEHGVLVDLGGVEVAGTAVARGDLGYVGTGAASLVLANPGDAPARAVLLGGEPFGEELVMWWNFVGRSHEEVAAHREAWQRGSDRFGEVVGYPGDRLPAPPMPTGRLRPRPNPAPHPGRPADAPATAT